MDELLTVNEAAERLKLGRTTVYALIKRDEIETVKIGRLRRVPPAAVSDYIERLRAAA